MLNSLMSSSTFTPVRRAGSLWRRNGRSRSPHLHVRRPARPPASAPSPPPEPRAAPASNAALWSPCAAQHHAQQHGQRGQRRTEERQGPDLWVWNSNNNNVTFLKL